MDKETHANIFLECMYQAVEGLEKEGMYYEDITLEDMNTYIHRTDLVRQIMDKMYDV